MKNKKMVPVITVDGPSGTGKGTICHMLAKHLGWHVLDSGSIYRVLALAAQKKGMSSDEKDRLLALACNLNVRFEASPDNPFKVILDEEEVSEAIRSEQCGQYASIIAAIPELREVLLARQRAFAIPPGLVTDGRDMGTVVFPEAVLKIYLHASAEERAKRRYFQLKDREIDVSLAQVVDELTKRDARDSERSCAPLKMAEDAVCVDTTGLSIVQVLQAVLKLINERLIV